LKSGRESFVIHSFACLTDRIFTCGVKATTFWPHHKNCRRNVVEERHASQSQDSKLNPLIWSPIWSGSKDLTKCLLHPS